MSSSSAPEFDLLLRDFIASFARSFLAASPPQDHDGEEQLVFTVFSNRPLNLDKDGPLPASKWAIDDMPTVTVTEEEDCAICLTEYGAAGEAKEMPCKHRYHSDCIMKWLGIHGSCPVCRYEMPVDEEEKHPRDGDVGWQVMIAVTNRTPLSQPGRGSSDLTESNGSSTEDMDIDGGSDGDGNHNNMDLDDLD